MTGSITKSPAKQELQQRIDRVLDFTPDVKIRKLENGAVQVNQHIIKCRQGTWWCEGVGFFRRKSAVGYALCLVQNNTQLARMIHNLDQKLQKVKCDIDVYHYHLRRRRGTSAILMENRISADMPLLYSADTKLTQLLKTVKV